MRSLLSAWVCLLASGVGVLAAEIPKLPLAVVISAPSVVPGAIAQIRFTLATPHRISSGSAVIDFDPLVFGPVIAVDAFSATGDQNGHASVTNNHVVVRFSSDSGGLGSLPGIPTFTVTLPVFASATTATAASIVFLPGDTAWTDAFGNVYAPKAQPVRFKVGGGLSIDDVTPGGGLLPSGAMVRIAGQGFTASTTVQIDGVAIGSQTLAGPQAIDIVLPAPADLTGKRVSVQNPGGAQADFFPALRGGVTGSTHPDARFIFPQQTYVTASPMYSSDGLALQNPTLEPVDVSVSIATLPGIKPPASRQVAITLPPGGIFRYEPGSASLARSIGAVAGKPVRMLFEIPLSGSGTRGLVVQWTDGIPTCTTAAFAPPVNPGCWLWLKGSPPASKTLTAYLDYAGPFTATATTEGGDWLILSRTRGIACGSCPEGRITLTNDPSLAPGDYQAAVTVTPDDPAFLPVTLPFTFRVAKSLVSFKDPPHYLFFNAHATDSPPQPPVSLHVTATEDGTPFTVSVQAFQPNPKWLLVSPLQGVTPAAIGVTVDPSAKYTGTASVVVTGPSNDASLPVGLYVYPVPMAAAYPNSLTFWAKAGGDAPSSQSIQFAGGTADTLLQVATDPASPWLTAQLPPFYGKFAVSANPTGLSPGVYRGSLILSFSNYPDSPPARVLVTFVVWGNAPKISVVPSSLTLTAPSGMYLQDGEIFSVSSDGLPVEFSTSISTDDGRPWLFLRQVVNNFDAYAPYGSAYVAATAQGLPPGTYHGAIHITAPPESPDSIQLPVTFNVTPALPLRTQPGAPLAISIVNAASLTAGPISPGELLTIFGLNIGPSPSVGFSMDVNGKVSTNLAGLRVMFDGVQAPLLYASATQVNVVVPYEAAHKPVSSVVIEFDGQRYSAGVPAAQSAPAIFTENGAGQGQPRGVASPVPPGSTIHILSTGLGQTSPSATGEIAPDNLKKPILPVSVTIGGVEARVLRIGSVANQVAGVFGLDIIVPAEVAPGAAVPIVLRSGSFQSPDGVSIAVR